MTPVVATAANVLCIINFQRKLFIYLHFFEEIFSCLMCFVFIPVLTRNVILIQCP